MGRPRKKEQLVSLSSRITPKQQNWLEWQAKERFDGELSRTLRWTLDQGMAFSLIMMHDDPVLELDMILNPEKYPHDEVEWPSEEELRKERLRRERTIARSFSYGEQPE